MCKTLTAISQQHVTLLKAQIGALRLLNTLNTLILETISIFWKKWIRLIFPEWVRNVTEEHVPLYLCVELAGAPHYIINFKWLCSIQSVTAAKYQLVMYCSCCINS